MKHRNHTPTPSSPLPTAPSVPQTPLAEVVVADDMRVEEEVIPTLPPVAAPTTPTTPPNTYMLVEGGRYSRIESGKLKRYVDGDTLTLSDAEARKLAAITVKVS